MRKRLLLLGVLGVLMTLTVAVAAIVSLSQVGEVNRELTVVNRALHRHQTADALHDALRADVARAQLFGAGRPGFSRVQIERETARHATRFRANLRASARLDLPGGIERALGRLNPKQQTFIDTSVALVDTALSGQRSSLIDQVSYEAAFRQLVPAEAAVTARLMRTSERVEAEAAEQRNEAERVIGIATLFALMGWLGLVAWHYQSIRRLRAALLREAEQRSAADLLQGSLLPATIPEVPGVRLAARAVPGTSGRRVGGDWYDVIRLPDGQVCLVVGDVVGHDLSAAAVMGQLRNALRAYALEDSSPAGVLAKLNRAAHLLAVSDLATCICAVLDPTTGTVRWASAGHLPPLLTAPSGRGRLLVREPGPPLGVAADLEFPMHTTTLAPGAALLLFSDGLVERRGVPIDTGLRSLESLVIPDDDPEARCDVLLSELVGNPPHGDDDVTVLLLRRDGQQSATDRPPHDDFAGESGGRLLDTAERVGLPVPTPTAALLGRFARPGGHLSH